MPREDRDGSGLFYDLVKQLMVSKLNKDPHTCEECGKHTSSKRMYMHHTKYVGATLYDLMFVCQSCNTLAKNRNLHEKLGSQNTLD
jgi:5-methylcytosine-specific restriction endonuclease McrA